MKWLLYRRWKWLVNSPKRLKWRWQRVRHGYSEADSWSLDFYLATIIAGGCRDLATRSLSHPIGMTPVEWSDILLKIADGFDQWADDPWANEMPKYDEAMILFAKWFPALWD